jgi:NAD(P)-dependent dehydrogenase (short-subunit alcohol dehydrogenase family)
MLADQGLQPSCAEMSCAKARLSRLSTYVPPARLRQYACSKACNILHARELQDRYQASRGIIATSISPGFVNTSIFRCEAKPPHSCDILMFACAVLTAAFLHEHQL